MADSADDSGRGAPPQSSAADHDQQPPKSSSCLAFLLSCLHVSSSKSTTDSIQQMPRTRQAQPDAGSVYVSAAQSAILDPEDLEALREFEDAADALITAQAAADNRESIYMDALSDEIKDDWSYLMTYMPASKANTHIRGSVAINKPDTLLAAGSAQPHLSASVVRRRLSSIIGVLQQPAVKIDTPGYPGELTEDEVSACLQFRQEIAKKCSTADTPNGKLYREIVDCFHSVEEEPYALCRFLRARKFDVDAVMVMLDEGIDIWADGKKHNFFPDASLAVGNPIAVLRTQYPVIYSGIAKNGCPVSYFKAGQISVEGLECVTTLEKLSNLAWHQMIYTFPKQIAKAQASNPDAVRCESVAVIDLKGLSASSLNARTLEVLKRMAQINSCFPEILNCMLVLNAPKFFSFSWTIIRRFLDPRTVAKIKIFADGAKGKAWLFDRVDADEVISDYGGTGPSFDKVMQAEGGGIASKRRIVELLSVAPDSKKDVTFELSDDETAQLDIYTRSVAGCHITILKDDELIKEANLQWEATPEDNGNVEPFRTSIMSGLEGPGKFQFVVQTKAFEGNERVHFLLIGEVN